MKNDDPQAGHVLSRREALVLFGTAGAAALAACAGLPETREPTTAPSQIAKVEITPRSTQSYTSSPTPTAEPTPTENPYVFGAGGWATFKEGENAGRIDSRKMFPLVGGIDHKNRQMIDLNFGEYQLAYYVGGALTYVEDQPFYRENLLDELNLDDELIASSLSENSPNYTG